MGHPISVNDLYWNKGRIRFITPKGRAWKTYVTMKAKQQWEGPPLHESVRVKYYMFFSTKQRRDLANFEKAITDSLNGIAFDDDSQIDEMTFLRCHDKLNPRVEVVIEAI